MPTAELTNHRGSDVRVGTEIANAWGWMLARAPRIARALEAMPGAPSAMARVLAGFDFFQRRYGLSEQQMARVTIDVSYNEATDTILVRLTR